MSQIRVLLFGVSGMVADIVREVVSQQDDMKVIPGLRNLDEVEGLAQRAEVDVVITGYWANEFPLRRFDRALVGRPGLSVLAIENDGRTACMYRLVPQTTALGPLSPKALVDFIRASVRSDSALDRS